MSTENFQMYKLGLGKAETKLPTFMEKAWAQRTDEQLEGTGSGGMLDYKAIEGKSVGGCPKSLPWG